MTFAKVKTYILFFYAAFVPLFFLPAVQDLFATAKWYFTGGVVFLLLGIALVEFLLTKKMRWHRRDLDGTLFLFLIAISLSVVLASTNKVEALLLAPFGLLTFVFLALIAGYFARMTEKDDKLLFLVIGVGVGIAVTALFQFIPALAHLLPKQLASYVYITPVGRPLDTLVFLLFAAVVALGLLFETQHSTPKLIALAGTSALLCIATGLVIFSLVSGRVGLVLPPFTLSWYAALEVLKHPLTALFGAGVGNFQSVFLQVKDAAYNASPLWQVATFEQSRTVIFQFITETGLFGLVSFGMVLGTVVKMSFNERARLVDKVIAVFVLGAVFLFPPTFILFMVIFLWFGLVASRQATKETVWDLHEMIPVYAGVFIIAIVIWASALWVFSRMYMAEATYQQALSTNNLKMAYDLTRSSLTYNPSNERVHSSLAQINMLIANTIAGKDPAKLSDTDKQTVSQAIQAAIDEAKATVTLNPTRATNWELLATVYRSIMGVVQGADAWTISAYQRAVVLDPQNPTYRVALGGILYGQKQYEDASRMFEVAVSLKPDWPNAQYNYAWSLEQKGDYQKAAAAMQTCISLLDPAKNAADYKKATADLETFKQKLPPEQSNTGTTQPTGTQKETLTLPQEKVSGTPQITLPAGTSPSAK